MSDVAIEFENVSKMYRLGLVGTGTLGQDLNRWWKMNILHQEDPYLKIGQTNDRSTKGTSDFVYALKNIDFQIEKGDVVGIIGKNGAGKSTLLKLLSRITAPTTGQIKTRGRLASLLEVGTGFHPELTGRENIYMNGSIMGMTRAEITRKLDEIIDFAGVERYIDTPCKRYSSGMQVRLGFAVAAFLEPEILVVDEVLAVGDAEFQKKAIGKMQDVSSGEGRTVLFVSHNMNSVRSLCKSGVVLSNGMVEYIGTANEAVELYLKDNFQKLSKSVTISSKHRQSIYDLADVKIMEVSFLDDPTEMSTDSPIELEMLCKVINNNVHDVYFGIFLNDALSGQRLFNYYSKKYVIPQSKDEFVVRFSLTNHSLQKKLFSVDVEVSRPIEGMGGKVMDYVRNVLTFDIKYRNKKEKAVWNYSNGLISYMEGEHFSIKMN